MGGLLPVCSDSFSKHSESEFTSQGFPFPKHRVDEAPNIKHPSKPVGSTPTKISTPASLRKSPINPRTGKPVTWVDPLYNNRGEDFPPYSSSRNTRDSRKTRLRNSDIAYKPTDFLKHQYAPKNQWDGTTGTF